jgi:hypothetical protein
MYIFRTNENMTSSVAQSSQNAPSEIMDFIVVADSWHLREIIVVGFLPQGMLIGWVEVNIDILGISLDWTNLLKGFCHRYLIYTR